MQAGGVLTVCQSVTPTRVPGHCRALGMRKVRSNNLICDPPSPEAPPLEQTDTGLCSTQAATSLVWRQHIELWPLEGGCSRCGIFFVGLEITRRNSKVTGEIRAFP